MIEASELIDCQPASPFCPAAWRWCRAEGIRLGLPGNTGRPDPWVGLAIRLQDHLAAHGPSNSLAGLGPGDRAALRAHEVRFAADPRPRQLLEARVLAGQPVGTIAASLGLTTEVIETYEAIFFDVRGKLEAHDYVAANVIGHFPHEGIDPHDVGALLRAFAFDGGPTVLEAVIEHLGLGASSAGAKDPGLARAIGMAIAARAIPVDERTAPSLIRLNARLLEGERQAVAGLATKGPIRAVVEPWATPAPGWADRPPALADAIDDKAEIAAGSARDGACGRIEAASLRRSEVASDASEAPRRWTA